MNEEDKYIDDGMDKEVLTRNALQLREVNQAKAHTSELPPEILTSIFHHALEKGWGRTRLRRLLALAGVCYLWRQIIWSSPSLWAVIHYDNLFERVRSLADVVTLHLQNAADAPLSIEFRPHGHDAYEKHSDRKFLRRIFASELDNISFLTLDGMKRNDWDFVATCCAVVPRRFSRLEELKLSGDSEFVRASMSFSSCPRLRRLTLYSTDSRVISRFPFSTLTELNVNDTKTHVALFILAQCPNLNNATFGHLSCDLRSDIKLPETMVALPKLKTFAWYEADGMIPDLNIFRYFRFSSVHTIDWETQLPFYHHEEWLPFFSCMTVVKVLRCPCFVGVYHLLGALPSLECLHATVSGRRVEGPPDMGVEKFLSLLILQEGIGLIPNLRECTLEGPPSKFSDEFRIGERMIEMLKSRALARERGIGLRVFTLKVNRPLVVNITQQDWTVLQDMILEGFRFFVLGY